MTTGASPISGEVIDFMRICFSATVIEGYGMTETACTISMTLPEDTTPGHVGGPLPCCEVKLEDIPEMGYTNADQPYPRGEVPPNSQFASFSCGSKQRHCMVAAIRLCMRCAYLKSSILWCGVCHHEASSDGCGCSFIKM